MEPTVKIDDLNRKVIQEYLKNELPHGTLSWMDFYDSLPEELRAEPSIKASVRVDDRTARTLGFRNTPPDYEVEIRYLIERDFMLARIGEALLESRFTITELNEFRHLRRDAQSFEAHEAHRSYEPLLKKLFRIARRK